MTERSDFLTNSEQYLEDRILVVEGAILRIARTLVDNVPSTSPVIQDIFREWQSINSKLITEYREKINTTDE